MHCDAYAGSQFRHKPNPRRPDSCPGDSVTAINNCIIPRVKTINRDETSAIMSSFPEPKPTVILCTGKSLSKSFPGSANDAVIVCAPGEVASTPVDRREGPR